MQGPDEALAENKTNYVEKFSLLVKYLMHLCIWSLQQEVKLKIPL